jgi:biopolymer transport protein ExbB/TolQ
MDLLNNLYLNDILYTIAQDLLVPVVVMLLGFILFSIYTVGSVIIEAIVERRHYRAAIPELIARVDAAQMDQLAGVIDRSGLLRDQKDDLDELVAYMYLPEDAHTEVAKRLMANLSQTYEKPIGRTDMVAKIGPMLGLMGTLIPLGPGMIALGNGDVSTLSSSLLVAFDTTIAGLATAAICIVVSKVRQRWYSDYLVSMEALFNSIIEKARNLHISGYKFEVSVYQYDKAGHKAKKKELRRADSEVDDVPLPTMPAFDPAATQAVSSGEAGR